MDTEAWNNAERRRVDKFREIKQLIVGALGPDVDAEQEVNQAIVQWEETVEMETNPPEPRNPLQVLLREHHDICEEILNIEDEE